VERVGTSSDVASGELDRVDTRGLTGSTNQTDTNRTGQDRTTVKQPRQRFASNIRCSKENLTKNAAVAGREIES